MRRTQDRRGRDSKSNRRQRSQAASTIDTRRTVRHGSFGEIPLVPTSWTDAQGREQPGFAYDASYRPAMPKGAVRGDVTRQHFCPMCHVPRYFYVDAERTCVQCGSRFVFGGAEQKFWYESLQFHFDSVPTRCPACRRKRRSDKALQRQLAQVSAEVEAHPDNPTRQIAFAEAIVRLYERSSTGSLPRAIAACRKARRLGARHPGGEVCEAIFWEAKAHSLAGRAAAARELFQRAVALGTMGGRKAHLLAEAKAWLAEHPAG